MVDTTSDAAQLELAAQLAATRVDALAIEEIEIADTKPVMEPIEKTTVAEPVAVPVQEEHIVDDEPTATQPVVEQKAEPEQPVKEEQKPKASFQSRVEQKTTITEPIFIKEAPGPDDDTLVLPSNFDSETRQMLERVPNIDLLDDPNSREWAIKVNDGLGLNTFNEAFVPTLEDQEADFGQYVDFSGNKLSGMQPKMKQIENQTLKGERAAIRLMKHLGLGTLFQTPLWHTGIWVTFKAPTESEIVELNRQIFDDKIKMGRYTYGLAFSNTSAYTTQRLVDFALDHLYDTTAVAEEIPGGSLKNLIKTQDYPSLVWGFVCTMYPRGFHFDRACISDPTKCNHVVSELLNVSKLQWVNRNALTAWQKTHMSTRNPNTKDLASIKRYQEELSKIQEKRVVFYKDDPREVAVVLQTPTISDYIESGHRWIGDIVEMVNTTFGMDANENDRRNYITRHSQASALRQYVHWIKSIEFASNVVDERETIEKTFNMLSSDNEIREDLTQAVTDYINQSTVAVIGIPVYDCPKCGVDQNADAALPHHKNIIPLDVNQLFFGLITQRLTKITER